jgi:hypothetical protein
MDFALHQQGMAVPEGCAGSSNRRQAIARRMPERKRGPEIPLGNDLSRKEMAVPEGFEPSIRLFNRITV